MSFPSGGGPRRISPGSRIRYFVNNLLIRNPAWQILALVTVSAVIIVLGMLLVGDLIQGSFWWSFTRLLDQGTFIGDNQYEPQVATVGVMVTIGGILVLSLLIGIFSSKITEQLDALKRGRSTVLEKDHYIVCGTGDRLYEVTRELLRAREETRKDGKIVIFSESSREVMEEILAQRLGRKSVKQVICRSGNTTDVDSLQLPCFQRCSGFVIVGDDDSRIIKTLVGINSLREGNRPVGVCELRSRSRERIAGMAFHDIHCVPVREVVMRLIVQVCRQPGLSAVYSEILSFAGNEFYIEETPEAEGLTFGEIARRIRGKVAAGIMSDGKLELNPAPETIFNRGNSLLVLAEDSRPTVFSREESGTDDLEDLGRDTCRQPLRMLVLSGQSRRFTLMLRLLEEYSVDGAEIVVAGGIPSDEGEALMEAAGASGSTLRYLRTDRTDPECIESLHPEIYDSIMVVSGKAPGMTDEDADSECIVSLLILRDIADRMGGKWGATVVSEIRNPRNRRLASAAGIDDFVISNEVCSMIMAQLVRQPDLRPLYDEIFDPEGCEIQLRCPRVYDSRTFDRLIVEGLARREVALGWLTGTGSEAVVSLNPPGYASLPDDGSTKIIVIAER
ncbi:MAG: hypothetical protein JXA64_01380 [Candidatus Fermentibacteraceae bacterium]|nr:hypothetical protein [Candidatus Fermentibacteraceae bacterium]MBN2607738.1 hypothetical protein [Candidatus Fermentibacteraceae bacterium]